MVFNALNLFIIIATFFFGFFAAIWKTSNPTWLNFPLKIILVVLAIWGCILSARIIP